MLSADSQLFTIVVKYEKYVSTIIPSEMYNTVLTVSKWPLRLQYFSYYTHSYCTHRVTFLYILKHILPIIVTDNNRTKTSILS